MVRAIITGQRGAVAAEFVLIFPLFMILVLGIISVGFGWFTSMNLSQAAREAARFGAVQPAGEDVTAEQIVAAVVDKAISAGAGGAEVVCVAYVGYEPLRGSTEIATVDNSGGGSACFDDGRPDEERRIQVVLGRDDVPFNWFAGSDRLDLRGTASARYEATRPELPEEVSP